jgi:hypothetical protein
MKSNPVYVPEQCKQANPVRFGAKRFGVCFNIVAFIFSLLQYFIEYIAIVCFALQPFTISGEDK